MTRPPHGTVCPRASSFAISVFMVQRESLAFETLSVHDGCQQLIDVAGEGV